MTGRRSLLTTLVLVVAAGVSTPGRLAPVTLSASRAPAALPARLTDAEFWKLVEDLSEPDGFFPSNNLVSNEDTFQVIIPDLQRVVKPGGVYVGVGPDQNFTYIAALKPAMVFIPDVRRGNLHMHLMYKALMEQSPDRAEFLSRLFSRKRPDGLGPSSTAVQLFHAYSLTTPTRAMYEETLEAILTTLRKQHAFKLADVDAQGIGSIFSSFFTAGPFLSYSNSPPGRASRYPSFAELQTATDGAGVARAYLATEENYRAVRALQQNNLIVPLVGNFAGPTTIRAVGGWVRERGAKVTLFYSSNVEQYLFQDRIWDAFAGNLAALPLDETSTFIRSCFNNCVSPFPSRVVMLLDSVQALIRDHQAGLIRTYYDVLSRQR